MNIVVLIPLHMNILVSKEGAALFMLPGFPAAGFALGFKRELAFFLGIRWQIFLLLLKNEEGMLCVTAREGTKRGLWLKDLWGSENISDSGR